ncbi:DNA polymerase III subunit delta' [Patescibacteria group bacterium]|nr:DNA polymerase III subunit delta' [Patescibacteria group bacterium]MBU1449174.1 DNA polymerase III subunit delta' [Patescibacteria group bacterium]
MKLSGVLGQDRAKTKLEAELKASRLAHAYLFVGPEGCGRGTLALALFQAVNCEKQDGDEPCGECGSCRRALAGQHEDLMVLAPPKGQASAQIKVEEVREVIRTLSFAPYGGGTRLVLIREAEHLNLTSANVLLKTLEEPPPGNLIVLTVQDAKGILPTLVSRCRRVNLLPLTPSLIAHELEQRGMESEPAALKAAMSGGSLGRALEMDEARLASDLEKLVSRLTAQDGAVADWAFAEEMVREFRGATIDREGLVEALDLLAVYFRDQAVSAAGRPQGALLPQTGPGLGLETASQGFSAVRRAQAQIQGNASPELALTVLLGKLRGAAA